MTRSAPDSMRASWMYFSDAPQMATFRPFSWIRLTKFSDARIAGKYASEGLTTKVTNALCEHFGIEAIRIDNAVYHAERTKL